MTKDLNEEVAAGRGIIANCDLGFCIKVSETAEMRARIEVDTHPMCNIGEEHALREFMEETAITWLRIVAPHRLALGANER